MIALRGGWTWGAQNLLTPTTFFKSKNIKDQVFFKQISKIQVLRIVLNNLKIKNH